MTPPPDRPRFRRGVGTARHLPSRASVLAPLGALALAACDLGPTMCDTGISPAVTVAVVDAVTGAPLAAGSRGYVADGSFRDSLRIVRWSADAATHLGAADARPGSYTIVIERPGYARWERTGVRTRADGCSAKAPEQRAELVPLS